MRQINKSITKPDYIHVYGDPHTHERVRHLIQERFKDRQGKWVYVTF